MIPCNRCGVPVPQNRYSVKTDRMCADCKRELLDYERNTPADDLADDDDEPERICVNGHRAEQVLFSAAIVLVVALSFALGAGVAIWRFGAP